MFCTKKVESLLWWWASPSWTCQFLGRAWSQPLSPFLQAPSTFLKCKAIHGPGQRDVKHFWTYDLWAKFHICDLESHDSIITDSDTHSKLYRKRLEEARTSQGEGGMKNQWGWVPKTTLTKSGADTLAATREIKCLSDSHFCCLNVTLTDISTCSLRHKLMEFMSIVCNLACCLKKQETRSANFSFSTICSKVAIFYYCCTLCNKDNHSRSGTLHSSSQLHWRWSTEVFNFLEKDSQTRISKRQQGQKKFNLQSFVQFAWQC